MIKNPFNSSKIKIEKYYSNTLNVNVSEIEVLTFPWYIFYRDNPFVQNFEKNTKENLELFSELLINKPKIEDDILFLYRKLRKKSKFLNSKNIKEKLGIRYQTYWLFKQPTRTGSELIFNRLQTFNKKNWCLQAQQRLKRLKKQIVIIEKQNSLDKNERFVYRNLIKIRNKIFIRIRILTEINFAKIKPHWLILQCLPILPPDLRPILSLDEEKIIVADINTLYQRVIDRNKRVAQRRRLRRFYKNHHVRDLYYHERLLQEALSCLFENTIKRKRGEKESKKREYKSLAEALKGKRGRFRNNLLGKRVNYSRRSVIVSRPEIAMHQCGLPCEIILTLFQPFFIRSLLGQIQNGKKIYTSFQARKFIEQQTDETWIRRKQILHGFPVLLNRAPTLHRFGFQAFQPQLVHKQAIQLHPLSCSGFNADFDGDQIAVHVPLSPNARAEAWRFIIPGSHFFSPANSEIIFIPSQDIILGTYYITTRRAIFSVFYSFYYLPGFVKNKKLIINKKKWKSQLLFLQKEEVADIFEKNILQLDQFIWLYIKNPKINCIDEFIIYEIRLNKNREEQKSSLRYWEILNPHIILFRTIVGQVIFSYLFF
jgi:DNA-directed RNA polymerase beta' subunit